MWSGLTGLVTAVLAGVAGVIGAWALLVRAKGNSLHLLQRLVDALQSLGLWDHVPNTLRSEIEEHLMRGDQE